MARSVKSAALAEQKAKQPVLTEEQLYTLRDISFELNKVKNTVADIGEDRDLDSRNIGFIAGKVHMAVKKIEEKLDIIIHQIDPEDVEEDDIEQ